MGKGTGVRDHSDVDLLVVLNNFKSVEALSEDISTVIRNFKEYLTSTVDKKMGAKTGITIKGSTPYTLQFSVYCDDGTWIDVDLLPIVDVWSTCKFNKNSAKHLLRCVCVCVCKCCPEKIYVTTAF